jgi:GT2 family glycosyltransferase
VTRVTAVITTVDPERARGVFDLETWLVEAHVRTLVFSDYETPLWVGLRRKLRDTRTDPLPSYPEGLRAAVEVALREPCDLLLVLNDDLAVRDPYWLRELVRASDRHPGAILGPKLLYPDGRVQHGGGFLLRVQGSLVGAHYGQVTELGSPLLDLERQVEFVTGACMAIPPSTIERLGNFDGTLPAWEDSEFCLRAREAGIPTWYVPSSVLEHGTGELVRPDDYFAKQAAASRIVRRLHWRALWPDP